MKKRIFLLFFLQLITSYSQETSIEGVLQDNNKVVIPNVLVFVISDNGTMQKYQYSDAKGEFRFVLEKSKFPLYLKVTSFFYEEKKYKVSLNGTKKIVLTLTDKVETLDEVVVTSSKFSRDVISLNIHRYNIKKNESIEKTLKKIPGISIDKEGRIKYWNKEIDKILIDGDDLANQQYTFISKNLRSEVIEDIQVLKNFEENTILKKARRSDKIALNLKIKAKFKNTWFGNMSIGYGNGISSGNKLEETVNIGLLKKKIKLLNFTKYATLGGLSVPVFFGDDDYEQYNSPIYSVLKPSVSLPNTVTDNNKTFRNTFLVHKKYDKTIFRTTLNIGIEDQRQSVFRETDYFFQKDISSREKNNYSEKKILFSGEGELKRTALTDNYLVNKFKYKIHSNKSSSISNFENHKTSDLNKNVAFSFYDCLLHTYRFKKGLILNNRLSFGLSKMKEDTYIDSESLSSFIQVDVPVNQNADKLLKYIEAKSAVSFFINKKTKANVSFNYKNNEERFDIYLDPGNVSYKNDVVFKSNEFIIQPSLLYRPSRKVKLKGDFSTRFITRNGLHRFLLNYNAVLNLRFFGDLDISFAQIERIPSNQNLLQNYYLTDNNTFRRGGLFFDPLNYINFKFKLTNKDKNNTYNNEFSFSYRKTKTSLLDQYSLLDNINFKKTFLITKNGKAYVFKDQLIFLWGSVGIQLETTQSYLFVPLNNEDVVLNKLYDGVYDFEITTYFSSSFNFNVKFEYARSVQEFDEDKIAYNSKNVLIDVDWELNKEISFNLNGGVYELERSYYKIFNSSVKYVPENKRFSYELKMSNLLDEKEFSFQQRNSFYTSKTTIPLIPFYSFVSVKYVF